MSLGANQIFWNGINQSLIERNNIQRKYCKDGLLLDSLYKFFSKFHDNLNVNSALRHAIFRIILKVDKDLLNERSPRNISFKSIAINYFWLSQT